MSHHKRRRPKNRRAGCLLCKPNKMNAWPRRALGHTGFGKLRREAHAQADIAAAVSHHAATLAVENCCLSCRTTGSPSSSLCAAARISAELNAGGAPLANSVPSGRR